MTSFGDVNVGDKVRLTSKIGNAVEFRVTDKKYEAHARRFSIRNRDSIFGWFSDDDGEWSVEVLEPAPKPLPTTDGIYALGEVVLSTPLWALDSGCWVSDASGDWLDVDREDVPAGLVRLVPSSAVEEARAEVVKEIVAWLDSFDGTGRYIAGEIKTKFLGGKA